MEIREAKAEDLQQINLLFQTAKGVPTVKIKEYDLQNPTRISLVAEVRQSNGTPKLIAFGQAFQIDKTVGVRSGKLVEKMFIAIEEEEKVQTEFIKYWLLAAMKRKIADFFIDLL